jgi:hypothetical protein
MTTEDIRSTFRPVVLNDVKIINGFALVFLATVDAVAVVDKHPNGMRLSNGRKIYPPPPKDKKDAAASAADRAKIATAPQGLAPVASKPVQRALPVTPKVAQLSRPTVLPSTGTVINGQVQGLVAQTASMALAPSGVRVKLNNLPPGRRRRKSAISSLDSLFMVRVYRSSRLMGSFGWLWRRRPSVRLRRWTRRASWGRQSLSRLRSPEWIGGGSRHG